MSYFLSTKHRANLPRILSPKPPTCANIAPPGGSPIPTPPPSGVDSAGANQYQKSACCSGTRPTETSSKSPDSTLQKVRSQPRHASSCSTDSKAASTRTTSAPSSAKPKPEDGAPTCSSFAPAVPRRIDSRAPTTPAKPATQPSSSTRSHPNSPTLLSDSSASHSA